MRDAIAWVCAYIDESIDVPTLAQLAAFAELSPHHFHRAFTRTLGVTPRRYAAARRAERLADTVRDAPRVTDAAYDAGFGSSSGFYGEARRTLGMTPTAFRRCGLGEEIRIAIVETWLGTLLVARTERGVCAVRFGEDDATIQEDLREEFAGAKLIEAGSPHLEKGRRRRDPPIASSTTSRARRRENPQKPLDNQHRI